MACAANGPGSYRSNFPTGSVAVQIPISPSSVRPIVASARAVRRHVCAPQVHAQTKRSKSTFAMCSGGAPTGDTDQNPSSSQYTILPAFVHRTDRRNRASAGYARDQVRRRWLIQRTHVELKRLAHTVSREGTPSRVHPGTKRDFVGRLSARTTA